jgi:tetratricopeptide (TPR) repeat protein
MTFSVGLFRSALSLLAGLALSGCLRSAPSQLDEEKESHFMLGRSRVSAMDYQGAIEAFGRALEVNPKSGAAHFELACLFEKREADPAAAIYHYQQYLKLRPKAENTETVNQHIQALKQELARNISLGPVTERQQREFERLVEENRHLNEEVEKWRAHAIRLQALTNQTATAPAAPRGVKPATSGQSPPGGSTPPALTRSGPPPSAPGATTRVHRVRAGETANMIARQYRVRVDALLAANPRIEPRRLQVGQTLNIPAPNL